MKINENTGLYENYGLWHIPFWQTDTFYLIIKVVGCLFFCIVIFIVFRVYMRYQRNKKLSPWDQALFDLDQLQKNGKVTVVNGKEFYHRISEILKHYLHARFGYDVLSRTDTELVNCLMNNHDDKQFVELIMAILKGSEVIKFANGSAAQDRISQDYNQVRLLIQHSIPKKE